MKSSVIKEEKSYVTFITLNNPENGNAVNNDNLELIYQYLTEAENNDQCRIIVIQGKDKVFCKGMDFKNLLNNTNDDKPILKDFSEPYKRVIKTIRYSGKPVIALVDGDVIAGGMGILLACDIVIATSDSKFGLTEVLFGIIPAYVFPLLIERVSYKKARYLILTSKVLDAKQAYECGIVDEVIETDRLEKKLKEYIKRILYSSPEALKLIKNYSDKITNCEIDNSIDYAQEQLTALLNDKNNIKTIKNFMEGEKPYWAVSYK